MGPFRVSGLDSVRVICYTSHPDLVEAGFSCNIADGAIPSFRKLAFFGGLRPLRLEHRQVLAGVDAGQVGQKVTITRLLQHGQISHTGRFGSHASQGDMEDR